MAQVRAGGIDIAYDVHGDGTEGTVLLVCGTGQPAVLWGAAGGQPTCSRRPGTRSSTFDNRGMTGAACPTPPWTVGDMATEPAAVLEAVGPAHVVGVSPAAPITQTLALRHPDLVRSATFMFGGGQFGPGLVPVDDRCRGESTAPGADLPAGIETFLMLQAFLTPEQRCDPAMVERRS